MVRHYKDLHVYRQARAGALQVFGASKGWPVEERYALTDQVRRSSRSVCVNVAEAWAKRLYPRHFVSKLTDAYGEAEETTVWLDFALDHGYLSAEDHAALSDIYRTVCAGLLRMANDPGAWALAPPHTAEPPSTYDP